MHHTHTNGLIDRRIHKAMNIYSVVEGNGITGGAAAAIAFTLLWSLLVGSLYRNRNHNTSTNPVAYTRINLEINFRIQFPSSYL